jgi:hypothetical protein
MKETKVKNTPILFCNEMVKKLLLDEKTMTRRTLKTQPVTVEYWKGGEKTTETDVTYAVMRDEYGKGWAYCGNFKCPYGKVGDTLWVKESFYGWGHWEKIGTTKTGKDKWSFVYDSKDVLFDEPKEGLWSSCDQPHTPRWHKRNSLFMPKWASRIQLEITKTRVERLQDITEEDAKSEGASLDCPIGYLPAYLDSPYVYSFAQLWEQINGGESWQKNVWVWVVEFRRVK